MENNLTPTPYDGRRAVIVGDHPHAHKVAECMGSQNTNAGWMLRFKDVNDYEEFFVKEPKHVQWIK